MAWVREGCEISLQSRHSNCLQVATRYAQIAMFVDTLWEGASVFAFCMGEYGGVEYRCALVDSPRAASGVDGAGGSPGEPMVLRDQFNSV